MKQLGIPKIQDGAGKSQAAAVLKLLEEWNLTENVKFMCFDTTASNTGVRNGACKILSDSLGNSIIGLACRHHMMELIVAKSFQITVENSTSGPEIIIFQKFRDNWKNINSKNYKNFSADTEMFTKLKLIKGNILEFICVKLNQEQPRGDYKELLELADVFLNENKTNYNFKPPGALHRARWMSKIIYSIKLFMFKDEIGLSENDINGLRQFLLFIFKQHQIQPVLLETI